MLASLAPMTTRIGSGLRALADAAATPLVHEDFLDLFAPVASRRTLRGRVEAVVAETPDVRTLQLRPGPTWQRHVPGQYARVGVDVDGVRHWRTYSLTSSPDRADGRISITVKALPDGRVSQHLVHRTRPGDVVHLDQPQGDFVLPATAPPKVLFVTAGSGITPVMGMLRSRLDDLADVVVVHASPTRADAVFGAELRALGHDGRIRLVERLTRRDGRLAPAELATIVADLEERETWACGPGALLDDLAAHWARTGLTGLHVERFRPTRLEAGDGGTATFTGTGRTVEVDGGTSLLDAGEAAGVLMPSGCRMGICFGCVAPLRSGAVRDLRTGETTSAEPGDDVTVQTCVSTAATACAIEL